jgi:hypothetical protein
MFRFFKNITYTLNISINNGNNIPTNRDKSRREYYRII